MDGLHIMVANGVTCLLGTYSVCNHIMVANGVTCLLGTYSVCNHDASGFQAVPCTSN